MEPTLFKDALNEHHPHHEDVEDVEDEEPTQITEDWEKGVPPFMVKLIKMITENKSNFTWFEDGSFVTNDYDVLSMTLLPRYFKSIKMCSFVRQLNMYGFYKIEDSSGTNSKHFEFRNPNFVPGKPELLKMIRRRKATKRSVVEEEPKTKVEPATPSPPSASPEDKLPSPQRTDESAAAINKLTDIVGKLQSQMEMNQLLLKRVMDDLSFSKQSQYNLEQKLSYFIGRLPLLDQHQIPVQQGFQFGPPSTNSTTFVQTSNSPMGSSSGSLHHPSFLSPQIHYQLPQQYQQPSQLQLQQHLASMSVQHPANYVQQPSSLSHTHIQLGSPQLQRPTVFQTVPAPTMPEVHTGMPQIATPLNSTNVDALSDLLQSGLNTTPDGGPLFTETEGTYISELLPELSASQTQF